MNTDKPIIKFSASSVKTFESCPKKYFFTYIEKLPRKYWPHLELGTFSHAVLEQFHKEWKQDKNLDIVKLMSDCFAVQREKYQKLSVDQLDEAKSMLQEYLYNVEKNGMPNTLSTEEEFSFTIDKYIIRGFVDRIDVDKDGIFHIVDYKTTKNEKYLDDFQLLVYGLALKNKYPDMEKFRGSYVLLRHHSKYITNEFNLYDINKCEKKLLAYAQQIEKEQEWQKRPSPLCSYCDYYTDCMGGWI